MSEKLRRFWEDYKEPILIGVGSFVVLGYIGYQYTKTVYNIGGIEHTNTLLENNILKWSDDYPVTGKGKLSILGKMFIPSQGRGVVLRQEQDFIKVAGKV